MSKSVWISPTGDGEWKVKSTGSERAAAVVSTQHEAIERGTEIAKRAGAEVVVQGRNGQIREKNSYGNDPRRSKG